MPLGSEPATITSRDHTGLVLGYWAQDVDNRVDDWRLRSSVGETAQTPLASAGIAAGSSGLIFTTCMLACGLFPPACAACPVVALRGSTVLYNPSCKDAPTPVVPVPLEWGRGQQTKLGTMGYNLWVSRSGGQPPGCELFYEFELRFTHPGLAGSPEVLYTHMVMREGEDLLSAPTSATFGLPAVGALSPGRTAVRDAMGNYSTVSWKVRAVNGSQLASPWSAVRTAGPASGGVAG